MLQQKKNKLTNMSVSVRSQGVDTTETRQVSTKVPLAQVPYIMRALGFYPTEQEVWIKASPCKNTTVWDEQGFQ